MKPLCRPWNRKSTQIIICSTLFLWSRLARSFLLPGCVDHKITPFSEQAPLSPAIIFSKPNGPNDEIEDALKNEVSKDAVINPQLILGCSTLLLLLGSIPLLVVDPAAAIDHPVDFGHLKIPNPLPNSDPRYFISGGVCAAASHGVTTPIDVVKTRIQSEPEVFNEGIFNAATKIVREDGIQTLLSGLLPTVVGYGFEGGRID